MNRTALFWRWSALLGYLGLLGWIVLWQAFIAPSAVYPVALTLIVLLAPLLCALRGMLHGRRYTHQWMSMLSLFYFALGTADAYADPVDRPYGLVLLGLSLVVFAASIGYIRATRRPG